MYMKRGKHLGCGRETRRRRNSKGKEPMATFWYLCDGDRSRGGGRWDDGSIGAGGNRRGAQSASIQGLKETRGCGNNGAKDVGRRVLPWSERQMAVRRELRMKDGHEKAKRQSDRAAASRFGNEVPREVEKRWQTSDTNKKRRQQAEGARQSRFGMRWRTNLTAIADPTGGGRRCSAETLRMTPRQGDTGMKGYRGGCDVQASKRMQMFRSRAVAQAKGSGRSEFLT